MHTILILNKSEFPLPPNKGKAELQPTFNIDVHINFKKKQQQINLLRCLGILPD